MLKRYATALSLLTLLCAERANAQDRTETSIARDAQGDMVSQNDQAGFGVPRQWVFTTDAELSFRRTTLSGQDNATTTLSISPGVDYFVLPNLSLGGGIGVFYAKTGDRSATRFMIGPRIGYNFELTRLLSVWPKLGFSYQHTNQDAPGDNANAFALNLFAPVMVHPAKHFIAGLGPFLDADLSGDPRATSWGFKLTLGGWLNS